MTIRTWRIFLNIVFPPYNLFTFLRTTTIKSSFFLHLLSLHFKWAHMQNTDTYDTLKLSEFKLFN